MNIEFVQARSILTPTGGFLKPSAPDADDGYTHTLNPAIGCPFGRGFCGQFCYARAGMAHRFRAARQKWGEYLVVKQNAAELLRRELDAAGRRPDDHPHHLRRLRIFASSSTDPCAGPSLEVFRSCLRVITEYPIERIVVQTRSPQLLTLRAEIEALGERVVVSFTMETDSDDVWQRGPAGSPTISRRRQVFEQLHDWSVRRHLAVSPCLPLMNVEGFADWIAKFADDVTVDTFLAGDGAGGSRTGSLPLPVIFEQSGWDWRDESPARLLFEALQRRMGRRAGWSCAGFGRLAVCEPIKRVTDSSKVSAVVSRRSPQPAETRSRPGRRR